MPEYKEIVLKSLKEPLWLKLRIKAIQLIHPSQRRVRGDGNKVFRLPGRRIAKLFCHPKELEAMEFVRKHTTIPIPRVYEVYRYPAGYFRKWHTDEMPAGIHMVMEELPGSASLLERYGTMTPEQIKTFGIELGGYLEQLRALEPPEPGFIGSLSLGSNLDHRLSGTEFGPFHSIADFHTYLRRGRPLSHWEFEPDVVRVHKHPETYTVKFTHADLHADNILVQGGHITGIIDWEFAGWYPEYWEYTKMWWVERRPLLDNFYQAISEAPNIVQYEEEKAAEQAICKHMHPWSYDDPPWSPEDDEQQAQPESKENDQPQQQSELKEDAAPATVPVQTQREDSATGTAAA